MAIDFPDSPSVGDQFVASGKTYQWDGTVWTIYGPQTNPDIFKVDTTNNRVGINKTSPTTALDVVGDIRVYDASTGGHASAGQFMASGTGANVLPSGTTAQRPANPADGMIRYNSQLNQLESYVGGSWVILKKAFDATGGTITESDGYKIHTFTSSGTFSVSSGSSEIEYIVVAGGGGGGRNGGGGDDCAGGGAGGYRSSVSGESSGGGASAESTLTLGVGNYSVIVGAGGASDTDGVTDSTNDGSDSSFYTVTSVGGGSENRGGGSGGGEREAASSSIGSGTTGQGYAGGSKATGFGGGGGGAGEAGNTDGQGYGGDGVASLISGSLTYYAGGGGAGYASGNTQPGLGGGGAGGSPPQNGTANTGGGGGGASSSSGSNGGAGGSGIVIIRYLA